MSRTMKSNLFILSKHAYKYIAYAFGAFVLFSVVDFDFLAWAAFGFLLISLYLFRNPEKSLHIHEENAFLSPVDGKVVAIEEIEDAEYGYRVTIESAYLDVSLLRAPMDAKLVSCAIYRGTRLAKNAKLFTPLNENATLILEDNANHRVKIQHRLTRSFAPLFIDITEGEELVKGSRYGLMLCGVTTLYLPKSFKVNVERAAQVSASETLIGYFL